jgi:hypothetical protein
MDKIPISDSQVNRNRDSRNRDSRNRDSRSNKQKHFLRFPCVISDKKLKC